MSRITHHSDEAYVGALAIALTIDHAVHVPWRDAGELIAHLVAELPDTRVRDRLRLSQGQPIEEFAAHGTSGYVVDAVPLAIHAYTHAAETNDFESMVRELIEVGGDCDSIASMAAQCWGALRGDAMLSAPWASRLPEHVHATVERFARL